MHCAFVIVLISLSAVTSQEDAGRSSDVNAEDGDSFKFDARGPFWEKLSGAR